MSILEYFTGLSPETPSEDSAGIRHLIEELDLLTQDQAKYLILFSYLLSKVAKVDQSITPEESEKMEGIIDGFTHVSKPLAALILQIAKWQGVLMGKAESKTVLEQFKRLSSEEQREGLVFCLFEIANVNRQLIAKEVEEIHTISMGLGVSEKKFQNIQSQYH